MMMYVRNLFIADVIIVVAPKYTNSTKVGLRYFLEDRAKVSVHRKFWRSIDNKHLADKNFCVTFKSVYL